MNEQLPENQKQLAVRIARTATDEERAALIRWIEQLLEIKAANLPAKSKAKEAVALTAKSKVILPSVKMIGREIKRLGWDERSIKGRLGITGSLVGIALFGGQGAGIAALGTAIGVPLWVVFGAGAVFAGVLYEEITGSPPSPRTAHTTIDSESRDDDAA